MAVNRERVLGRMDRLAAFTEVDRPYTRRAFTPLYARAREWLEGELRQAGLAPRIDAGGNLVGRRDGTAAGTPALMLGSPIDTVIGGGRYDGMAGVVAALEVAQALAEHSDTLQHPLAVVDFLSEEPSDYGVSCVGSRAMAGTLTPDMLVATVGRIEVSPNAANVVPGHVRLTVEARSMVPERLDRFFATVVHVARDRLEQDGLTLQARRISDAAPVRCSEAIQETICRVAEQRGYRHVALQSGAGHDTMQVAQLCPVGMIFVPSHAGRSHVPDEYTAPEDLQAGVEVLCETVRQLDRSMPRAA